MRFRDRPDAGRRLEERAVRVPVAGGVTVDGDLAVPDDASGLVVFAHGSGSGRHSPRNRMVAGALQRRGLATLLTDLLTPEEEQVDVRTRHLRFDIELLAGRLGDAAAWLQQQPATSGRPVGYLGASTGAGAALVAAARRPEGIAAVVSRGGRPDLAGDDVADVQAPTLLIVGGFDDVVIGLNRQALDRMTVERRRLVPRPPHPRAEPAERAVT